MKKVLFFMMVSMFAVMLVACGSKSSSNAPSTEKNSTETTSADNEFSESPFFEDYVWLTKTQNGHTVTGLKKAGKIIIQPIYNFIEWDAGLDVFKCQTNTDPTRKVFVVTDMEGNIMGPGEYYKVTKDENGDYHLFTLSGEETIYSPKE